MKIDPAPDENDYPQEEIEDTICPECQEPCKVIPLDNSFDYSGTHCTGGKSGTHYPSGYGDPVSDCCEVDIIEYIESVKEPLLCGDNIVTPEAEEGGGEG